MIIDWYDTDAIIKYVSIRDSRQALIECAGGVHHARPPAPYVPTASLREVQTDTAAVVLAHCVVGSAVSSGYSFSRSRDDKGNCMSSV